MTDFVIDDASVHFAASKDSGYRARVRERFCVFIDFLQSNNLTTRTILETGRTPDESIKIRVSDLTPEGFQVVRDSYDKWLRGIDQGKPIADISVLKKCLDRIRGEQSGSSAK